MPKTVTTGDTKSSKSPQIPPAITYRLSQKYFLDLGWTSQASIMPVHTWVTMKAKFVHPVLSPWFKTEEEDAKRYYRDRRILCRARSDGTGNIYYPNGTLAISIEKATSNKHRTRIWVYTPEGVGLNGVRHSYQLSALFDSLGNGVVYDDCMNKRLVYNQREGVLWDSPIGIPINWQWHSIPYPKSLSVENEEDDGKSSATEGTKASPNSRLTGSKGAAEEKENRKSGQTESRPKLTQSERGLFEKLETWRFVDTEKVIPRTVSFVKPITLQINQHISLTIMSQADVTLKFYANRQHTQLKIGVLYNPYDVLQVNNVDDAFLKDRVLCPFESFPAKSQSMMRLKELIYNRRMEVCSLYSKAHP